MLRLNTTGMFAGAVMKRLRFMTVSYALFIGVVMATNSDLVLSQSWLEGLGAGSALAWAYTRSSTLRWMCTCVALVMLAAMVLDLAPTEPVQARAVFQGLSVGMALGLLAIAYLEWPKTHAYLKAAAEVFEDRETLAWLDLNRPENGTTSRNEQ